MLNRLLILLIGIAFVGCGGEQGDENNSEIEYSYFNLEYKEISILDNYTLSVPVQTTDTVIVDRDGISTTVLFLNDLVFECQSNAIPKEFIPSTKEELHASLKSEAILIDDTVSFYWLFAIDDGRGQIYCNLIDSTEYEILFEGMNPNASIEVHYNNVQEKKVITRILNSFKQIEPYGQQDFNL